MRFPRIIAISLFAAFLLAIQSAATVPLLPLAFFFDDPEDDREAAIAAARQWSPSEMATIDRPEFSLKYPSSWNIATHEGDYNPDKNFTIETDGQSHIVIQIYDITNRNLDEMIWNIISALDGPAIETYSYGDFDQWGTYQGKGKHLKGKVLGLIPGGARIFAAKVPSKGKGFLITEFYMSEDLSTAMPGFDLIGQSLNFK